jgi:predicted nuclease with RNAse H fold
MMTLGIDLSSMPDHTAACVVRWESRRAIAEPPKEHCDDDCLDELIARADAVGIDAPFGWPIKFVAAVGEWLLSKWDVGIRDRLRFRETDRCAQTRFSLSPLSVSSDRIALPAMRVMALLKRHGVTDRSGDGKFFEVYPAGSLKIWGLPDKGYKKNSSEGQRKRGEMLRKLRAKMPWLEVAPEYAKSADALDALVAALTVRAAIQGLTHRAPPELAAVAKQEGWIHLPMQLPSL